MTDSAPVSEEEARLWSDMARQAAPMPWEMIVLRLLADRERLEVKVEELEAAYLGRHQQAQANMASAQAAEARASRLEAENAKLKALLKSARGWVVTCSESATARKHLKMIDATLNQEATHDHH